MYYLVEDWELFAKKKFLSKRNINLFVDQHKESWGIFKCRRQYYDNCDNGRLWKLKQLTLFPNILFEPKPFQIDGSTQPSL